jgi:hypothetical protein
MKKLFLFGITALLGFVVPAYSQLQKGTTYLAGTVTFDGNNRHSEFVNNTSKNASNSLQINPSVQIGKFFGENKMIGIGLGGPMYLNWSKSKDSNGNESKYSSMYGMYTLSPYIRNYKPLSPKWALFLTSFVNVAFIKSTDKYAGVKTKRDGFSAGLGVVPGISYWISPRFAIESDINLLSLSLGYRSYRDTKSVYFDSAVTTGLDSYFSVRASWYIQKN